MERGQIMTTAEVVAALGRRFASLAVVAESPAADLATSRQISVCQEGNQQPPTRHPSEPPHQRPGFRQDPWAFPALQYR